MRSLATSGWGPPAVVVCGCLPLLGVVLVTVPRHSWLGSPGRGGGRLCGVGWGFLVVCVFVARCVRAWRLCWCVCRAFVVAWVWVCLPCVLVCVCVWVGVWLGLAGACRWCGCGCGWCVPWLVPRHSWRRFLSAISRHSWLGFAVGGGGCSSPLLAEGPGCGSPPLLAGVRWRRWCVVASHSWLRVPVAFPCHSWLGGLLVAVLGGPLPLLAEGLRGGSPPLLAGVRWPRRWVFRRVGFSCFVCACGAACACGACAGVCGVVCVRGVCVGGGMGVGGPSACVCVCVCVCVCGVLVACGVVRSRVLWGVWLVCGVVGPSPLLVEVPVCYSPPLLAGFRCRWWWAFLATPG